MLPAAITVIILLAILLAFGYAWWTLHIRLKDLEDAFVELRVSERRTR